MKETQRDRNIKTAKSLGYIWAGLVAGAWMIASAKGENVAIIGPALHVITGIAISIIAHTYRK